MGYATGAYSYREIAAYLGGHLATVERIVRKTMQRCENVPRVVIPTCRRLNW